MPREIQISYNAFLPFNVRHSQLLEPHAKLLYAELTALQNEFGTVNISTQDLASIFDVEVRTMHKLLNSLKDNGFIFADLKNGGFQANKEIRLNKSEV
jgi:helix-turn-helix protein